MTELELKAKLFQKLLKVKEQVTYLKKDTRGFNFEYASPELVLGTLNPILNEAGLFLKTEVISAEHERVFSKYKVQDLWVNKVKVEKEVEVHETLFHLTMKYTWIDTETGYEDSAQFTASGINNDEQGQGSAQTYGERYFLLKTFNIATGKDDPDALGAKRLGGTPQPTPNTPVQATTSSEVPNTPAKAARAPKTAKTPVKQEAAAKEPPILLDDKGNMQPNTAFSDESKDSPVEKSGGLADRQAKAKAFFEGYDKATVIKHIVGVEKLRYATVDDLIAKEPIETVLAIAQRFKEAQDKK